MLVWRGRPRPRAFMSGLTVVVLAKFDVLRRMLVTMIMPVFMFLRAALLLEENLARQFLFAVHEDIHLGRLMPLRLTREISSRAPMFSAATVSSKSLAGTPASTRAPRNMSPLMPEKQSR